MKLKRLTVSFLFSDGWCLEAFTLAQGRMLEELTNVLVMVVVGKVCIRLLTYFLYTTFLKDCIYIIAKSDFWEIGGKGN